MTATIAELPLELIAKNFSFFDVQETKNVSLVCTRFNVASKSSSLWQRCSAVMMKEENILTFCNFFSQVRLLQKLSLSSTNSYEDILLDGKSSASLNNLFSNCKQLRCLSLSGIDMSRLILPATLEHLNFTLSDTDSNYNIALFSFIDQCPRLKRLCFILRISDCFSLDWNRLYKSKDYRSGLTEAVKDLLVKYQSSLEVFNLAVNYCSDEWLPLIANCHNLKELRIDELCLASLSNLKLSCPLKIARVGSAYMSRALKPNIFSELIRLVIVDGSEFAIADYDIICFTLPKLEELGLRRVIPDLDVFFYFITIWKSLKYVALASVSNCDLLLLNSKLSRYDPENSWQIKYMGDQIDDFFDFFNNQYYKCCTLEKRLIKDTPLARKELAVLTTEQELCDMLSDL